MKKTLVGAFAVVVMAGSGLTLSVGSASAAPVRPAVYGCNYTSSTPEIAEGSSGSAVKEIVGPMTWHALENSGC